MSFTGKIKISAEGVQNLYQTIGLILSYKGTSKSTRMTLLQELYDLQLAALKTANSGPKSAVSFIKSTALLLRSFEFEADDTELKELVKKISYTALEILKTYQNDQNVRESILVLFHKLVILAGTIITPLVKEFIGIIMSNPLPAQDFAVLSAIIKLSNVVIHTWKSEGIPFVKEVIGYLVNSMKVLGFPTSKVSDIEKAHLELVRDYLKFLRSLFVLDPNIYYELTMDQFTIFFQYLHSCAICPLDEYITRQGVILSGIAVAASMGLNLNSENLGLIMNSQPLKTAKIYGSLPEYSIHTGIIMENTENIAVDVLARINLLNQDDQRILEEVGPLHFLLFRFEQMKFISKLEAWVNKNVPTMSFGVIKTQILTVMQVGNVKEYKEMLRHLISSSKLNK